MEEIKVTLLSEDKARMEKIDLYYWLYYNTLTYKADSTLLIRIEGEIENPRVKAGCSSCTTVELGTSGENDQVFEITYDTKNIGVFTKTVFFYYRKNGIEFQIPFKITGNVAR